MSETHSSPQVALVTGASRGIGQAIALELAQAGWAVIATATTQAGADRISQDLKPYSHCRGVVLNVNDRQGCDDLVTSMVAEFSGLHVLVNNAGITKDGLLMRMKTADWQSVIDLNLTGVFLCSRAVSRTMLKARSGRIINITSVVALMGNPGQANYSAAKAGVIGLTRSTAAEFASRGVTFNAVAPGFITTDMTKELESEAILRSIPLGRMGSPKEVAGVVRFLAADPAASYITGQVLQVDGGMVMR